MSMEFQRLIEKEELELDCIRLMDRTTIQNNKAEQPILDIMFMLNSLDVFKDEALTFEMLDEIYFNLYNILTNN